MNPRFTPGRFLLAGAASGFSIRCTILSYIFNDRGPGVTYCVIAMDMLLFSLMPSKKCTLTFSLLFSQTYCTASKLFEVANEKH